MRLWRQRMCWGQAISPALPEEEILRVGGQSLSGRGEPEQRPGENLCPEAWNLSSLAATDTATVWCQAWGAGLENTTKQKEMRWPCMDTSVPSTHTPHPPPKLNTAAEDKTCICSGCSLHGRCQKEAECGRDLQGLRFSLRTPSFFPGPCTSSPLPGLPLQSAPFAHL